MALVTLVASDAHVALAAFMDSANVAAALVPGTAVAFLAPVTLVALVL